MITLGLLTPVPLKSEKRKSSAPPTLSAFSSTVPAPVLEPFSLPQEEVTSVPAPPKSSVTLTSVSESTSSTPLKKISLML